MPSLQPLKSTSCLSAKSTCTTAKPQNNSALHEPLLVHPPIFLEDHLPPEQRLTACVPVARDKSPLFCLDAGALHAQAGRLGPPADPPLPSSGGPPTRGPNHSGCEATCTRKSAWLRQKARSPFQPQSTSARHPQVHTVASTYLYRLRGRPPRNFPFPPPVFPAICGPAPTLPPSLASRANRGRTSPVHAKCASPGFCFLKRVFPREASDFPAGRFTGPGRPRFCFCLVFPFILPLCFPAAFFGRSTLPTNAQRNELER